MNLEDAAEVMFDERSSMELENEAREWSSSRSSVTLRYDALRSNINMPDRGRSMIGRGLSAGAMS
jgi:hypothetical protein